jgi:hypothetical protein
MHPAKDHSLVAALARLTLGLFAVAACGSATHGFAEDATPIPQPDGAALMGGPPLDDAAPMGDAELPIGLVVERVAPAATDPIIGRWLDDHLVVRDFGAPDNGRLVVFFAGSTLLPSDYQLILVSAAHAGYRAIGLRYPNDWDASGLIDSDDPLCTSRARLEIIDGTDRTAAVSVDTSDSIVHRLVALLRYLDRAHPSQAWGQFLRSGEPNWPSLVVAGHSFGSGEAAAIALRHPVARLVTISGPNDHCSGSGAPAPWLTAGGATAPSDRFGFAHLRDPEVTRELAAWSALGLDRLSPRPGGVSVDDNASPYLGSHELVTAATPSSGSDGDAHRSTASDRFTPMLGQTPQFDPVWRDLFGR